MNLLRTLTNDNQSLNHLLREARGEISDLEKEQEKLVGHMNHLRGELEHVHKLYSNMEQAALTFPESPPPTARGPATAAMPRPPPPPQGRNSKQARRTGPIDNNRGLARPGTANPLHRPAGDFLAWDAEAETRPGPPTPHQRRDPEEGGGRPRVQQLGVRRGRAAHPAPLRLRGPAKASGLS